MMCDKCGANRCGCGSCACVGGDEVKCECNPDTDPDFTITFDYTRCYELGFTPETCIEMILATDICWIDLQSLTLNLDCQQLTAGDHPWPAWSGYLGISAITNN